MTRLHLASRRATRHLGRALAPLLRVGDRVWLEGPLGSGKTFFARGLLRALGLSEAIPVTSPTFALVHEHAADLPVLHLDLYRLSSARELDELGLLEAMPEVVAVIEWGARFRGALGATGLEIALAPHPEGGRWAELTAIDERGGEILRRLLSSARVRALSA
ncbi:MAG: tRNA (adenosine(37)-N6)-threonylcarbamoyltransferase complex ATPase subunit type 1 TsaE [Sandaracinaceae bacterium]